MLWFSAIDQGEEAERITKASEITDGDELYLDEFRQVIAREDYTEVVVLREEMYLGEWSLNATNGY